MKSKAGFYIFLMLLLGHKVCANVARGYIDITISIGQDCGKVDTINLDIFTSFYPRIEATYSAAREANGTFRFKVPVSSQLGYFRLSSVANHTAFLNSERLKWLLLEQLWQKGDSLTLSYRKSTRLFGANIIGGLEYQVYGKGALKFDVKMLADSAMTSISYDINLPRMKKFGPVTHSTNIKRALDILEKFRSRLDPLVYEVLKADYSFDSPRENFYNSIGFYRDSILKESPPVRKIYIDLFKMQLPKLIRASHITEDALFHSKNAGDYFLKQLVATTVMESGDFEHLRGKDWDSIYFEIKVMFSGRFRDKMLYNLFFNDFASPPIPLIDDAINTVSTTSIKDRMKEIRAAYTTNSTNIDLPMPDSTGMVYSLSMLKGTLLLVDFWYTGCGACAEYYQNVLASIESDKRYEAQVKVISISVDKDRSTWIRSLANKKYSGASALNLFTNGEGFEHPMVKYYGVSSYPTALLFDQTGTLVKFNSPELYIKEELVNAIDNLLKSGNKREKGN